MITGSIVTTDAEVEALRTIRNAGRQWMTGDTAEIAVEQQRAWWERMRAVPQHDFLPIIYRASGRFVGYGILSRRADDHLYVSLAVAPSLQGLGVGTLIYRNLASRVHEPVYAIIRKDNFASLKAAAHAGYLECTRNDNTITLRSR